MSNEFVITFKVRAAADNGGVCLPTRSAPIDR
jgi:hypothetical protein